MRDSRKLTHVEVDKITYGISSLDQKRRQLVREHIYAILARSDDTIYRQSFVQELMKLRRENAISDIEIRDIERAFLEE